MRRIGQSGLILMALCCAAAAAPFEVGTNAVKVLPERNLPRGSGEAWTATNAVGQGNIIRRGLNTYMAQNAGTLGTNEPVFVAGTELNGMVTLQAVPIGPRRGFVIQLQDEGPVWVQVYAAGSEGDGFMLFGENAHWSESGDGVPQGAVYVISPASKTNAVGAVEW
jgi:hypothetical protein